jgi:hypothetical protein
VLASIFFAGKGQECCSESGVLLLSGGAGEYLFCGQGQECCSGSGVLASIFFLLARVRSALGQVLLQVGRDAVGQSGLLARLTI